MTYEQKVVEFFEANDIKKDSNDYKKFVKDIFDGEGVDRELLKGRFVFSFEGKDYYFMHPKLQGAFRK